ncbi:hypothetical protein Tco_1392459 [Tanacetum coccineum]
MTMMNEGEPVETSPVDTNMVNLPADYSVTAKMDQLQNQINQVIIMMQNNTEASPSGSHNFMAGKTHRIIAHYISGFKEIWIIDSGATDHICTSLTLMHNIITCITPIFIYLPNGQTTKVMAMMDPKPMESSVGAYMFYLPQQSPLLTPHFNLHQLL